MLTTAQLVEAYGTDTDTIKRNKDSYTEGKHFYLLTGENLKRFMGDNLSLTISNMTRTLLPLDRNREHYYCTAGGVVGTTEIILSNNFNRNKEHYKEGKHYIVVEGEQLNKLFAFIKMMNAKVRRLYRWTEKGAFYTKNR